MTYFTSLYYLTLDKCIPICSHVPLRITLGLFSILFTYQVI